MTSRELTDVLVEADEKVGVRIDAWRGEGDRLYTIVSAPDPSLLAESDRWQMQGRLDAHLMHCEWPFSEGVELTVIPSTGLDRWASVDGKLQGWMFMGDGPRIEVVSVDKFNGVADDGQPISCLQTIHLGVTSWGRDEGRAAANLAATWRRIHKWEDEVVIDVQVGIPSLLAVADEPV